MAVKEESKQVKAVRETGAWTETPIRALMAVKEESKQVKAVRETGAWTETPIRETPVEVPSRAAPGNARHGPVV